MNWLIRKDSDAGKGWRQEDKGMTEDEIVGCRHWLDGHEFEQFHSLKQILLSESALHLGIEDLINDLYKTCIH